MTILDLDQPKSDLTRKKTLYLWTLQLGMSVFWIDKTFGTLSVIWLKFTIHQNLVVNPNGLSVAFVTKFWAEI